MGDVRRRVDALERQAGTPAPELCGCVGQGPGTGARFLERDAAGQERPEAGDVAGVRCVRCGRERPTVVFVETEWRGGAGSGCDG